MYYQYFNTGALFDGTSKGKRVPCKSSSYMNYPSQKFMQTPLSWKFIIRIPFTDTLFLKERTFMF